MVVAFPLQVFPGVLITANWRECVCPRDHVRFLGVHARMCVCVSVCPRVCVCGVRRAGFGASGASSFLPDSGAVSSSLSVPGRSHCAAIFSCP